MLTLTLQMSNKSQHTIEVALGSYYTFSNFNYSSQGKA